MKNFTNPQFTILLVDDEPSLSEALKASLEARNLHCVSKSDMSSALEYIELNKVSVLVTDIMMPAGDSFPGVDSSETGFYFVSLVRKKWPEISIICLSVIGDQNKINKLKKQNVLYLRKGETPLGTAVNLIESKARGIYSSR